MENKALIPIVLNNQFIQRLHNNVSRFTYPNIPVSTVNAVKRDYAISKDETVLYVEIYKNKAGACIITDVGLRITFAHTMNYTCFSWDSSTNVSFENNCIVLQDSNDLSSPKLEIHVQYLAMGVAEGQIASYGISFKQLFSEFCNASKKEAHQEAVAMYHDYCSYQQNLEYKELIENARGKFKRRLFMGTISVIVAIFNLKWLLTCQRTHVVHIDLFFYQEDKVKYTDEFAFACVCMFFSAIFLLYWVLKFISALVDYKETKELCANETLAQYVERKIPEAQKAADEAIANDNYGIFDALGDFYKGYRRGEQIVQIASWLLS